MWRRRGNDCAGSPSHCSTLNTMKRLRNGTALRFVALLARALLFSLRNVAVGVANGCAALAFADMPAKARAWRKVNQFLRGKAARDHRIPQDQDINARIAPTAGGVSRQAKRCA